MIEDFNDFFMYLFRWWKKGGALINACICIGTHNQPFLQNHSMDVYETHSHAPVYRLFGKLHSGRIQGGAICQKYVDEGVLLQSIPSDLKLQQQTEYMAVI